MKRNIFIAVAIFLLSLILTDLVVAAYYIDIDVEESNGTDYDMLAMNVSMDIAYLADNGYIYPDGLDVRVKNSSGSALPFMLVDDKLMFASAIDGDKTTGFQMTTDNTPLTNFPVIVGDGGYVTIADAAILELANDFEIEVDGWLDLDATYTAPSVAATESSKQDAETGTHTVDLPASIESGDLLLLVFSGYDSGAGSPVITLPADWVKLYEYGVGVMARCVAYKIAEGDEGASMTVTTDETCTSAHVTYKIPEYAGIPELATATGGDSYPNSPSLSPTWHDAGTTLWVTAFMGKDTAARTVSSYPTNYDASQKFIEGHGSGYVQASIASRQLSASSEDPGQFTTNLDIDSWAAVTIAIRHDRTAFIYKAQAFEVYSDTSNEVSAAIFGGTIARVTATGVSSGEHTVTVYADATNLKIDIDGSTEDSSALGGASVPDNSNDFIIYNIPYYGSYTHTTSDTLRLTYEPDDIISGTTLINETNPGTHDGAITWGANPAGISISTSGLLLDESYYYTGGESGTTDIFEPEPAELAPGLDNDKLDHNPLSPGVEGFAEASNGAFTESLVWYGGAWFILIAVGIALVILVREHLVFAGAVCFGLAIMFYVMGIFDYWVLIILGIFFGATLIHERMPTW